MWLALRQSRLVLTISDYSAKDIAEVFGLDRGDLRIAMNAPSEVYQPGVTDEERARALGGLDLPEGARWFTYVGGFNPHKRVDRLLRAHAALAKETDDPPHVLLVGSYDKDNFHGCRADLVRLIEELGTGDLVHWTGFVADEDLRVLHALALACVLPSEREGFGLPPIEAAACGTPVVATTESPLPEVLEGGGLFVDPGADDDLLEALRRLSGSEEERATLGAKALERVRALDWSVSARNTLDALQEAAA